MCAKLLVVLCLLCITKVQAVGEEEPFDAEDLVYLVKHLEQGVGAEVLEGNVTVREDEVGIVLLDEEQTGKLVNKVSGVVLEEEDDNNGNNGTESWEEGEEEEGIVLPRDLDDLGDDISDDISAGVMESLRLFAGPNGNNTAGNETEVETRQLPMYMFQGQYVSEPRLNRFIDGALRNMGNEVRVSLMDPIYFRVLPRGRVRERVKPLNKVNRNKIRRNKIQRNKNRGKKVKRRRPGFGGRRKRDVQETAVEEGRTVLGKRNRRRRQQLLRLKRKRLRARRRRRRRLLQRTRRKVGKFGLRRNRNKAALDRRRRQMAKKKQNIARKKKARARRRRRMVKKNVGGGRVEGLSRVQRDGDAEMQLFGNYTLIRSHMKVGPVEITMQFRTRKGIRRTGATLPLLRVHTVTRVNHEGSEMVDYLLERPHPETIQIRGNLFPKAKLIARNVFSRLFLPDSFLTHKMREKTGLALLSRPTLGNNY